jgi:ketosteroid isomerase-like protein
MKQLLGMLALAAVAIGSEQTYSISAGPGEAAIGAADQAWAQAVAARSVDQIVAFYDPEIVTAGSAMPPARGLAQIRSMWTSLLSQSGFSLTWKAEKVSVAASGTIGYSTGTWRTGTQSGPYFAVWRKQSDGGWKVLFDAAWYSAYSAR